MSLLQLYYRFAALFAFLAFAISGVAQSDKPKPFELTDADIKKLSRTEIDLVTSRLPSNRIYIYMLKEDSVGLLIPPRRSLDLPAVTIKRTYAYKDISKLVIINPKRKSRVGWIGSAIGLAAGVGVGLLISEDDAPSDNLAPLGQTTAPSLFEPIIGGVLGWSIGKTVGEISSRVKLSPRDRGFKKRMKDLNPHARQE